jgi:hypothetical protein
MMERETILDLAEREKRRSVSGPTILLNSGAYFSFEEPELSDFTLEDIAHGLAMTCRFAGQCPRFYSVAEHSVHVSRLVDPKFAWDALMHDAAEAFVCDMPKPLKELLPEYQVIEKRVERAIAARFGLRTPMPPEIKLADVQMLRAEQLQLMRNNDEWHWTFDVPEPDVTVRAVPPDVAKTMFLDRAVQISAAAS